jgi:hypothetical protein
MTTENDKIVELIDKALLKVSALCSGSDRWIMSIPAQPESDPDIVIFKALHEARKIITHENGLKAENERLTQALVSVRHEIFYFMIGNTSEKKTDSYKLLGALKEKITGYLSALQNQNNEGCEHG